MLELDIYMKQTIIELANIKSVSVAQLAKSTN